MSLIKEKKVSFFTPSVNLNMDIVSWTEDIVRGMDEIAANILLFNVTTSGISN